MGAMELEEKTVQIRDDFDPDKILESGQCFRPRKQAEGWYRFVSGRQLLYLRPLRSGTYTVRCEPGACWMPSVEGHVICGHTDFVTSFLYFDTKSWTLIAYCALMLSIVNLRIKVDVTISCLLFLHERVIPMQS